MVPKFNGFNLPGFDGTDTRFPRWCIVWDEKGWTAPVRRLVTGFIGKFVDTDGNTWDYCSELPAEYRSPMFAAWNDVPIDRITDPGQRAWVVNTRLVRDDMKPGW